MTMLIKNITVSNGLTVTHSTNGQETGKTVYSKTGLRAEIMLQSNDEWRTLGKPDSVQMSIDVQIDSVPDLKSEEMREWLRDTLIEMLGDRPAKA